MPPSILFPDMREKCSPGLFLIILANTDLSFMQQSNSFFQIDKIKERYAGLGYTLEKV